MYPPFRALHLPLWSYFDFLTEKSSYIPKNLVKNLFLRLA